MFGVDIQSLIEAAIKETRNVQVKEILKQYERLDPEGKEQFRHYINKDICLNCGEKLEPGYGHICI